MALAYVFSPFSFPDEAALRDVRNHLEAGEVPLTELDEGISLRDPSNNGILLTVAS